MPRVERHCVDAEAEGGAVNIPLGLNTLKWAGIVVAVIVALWWVLSPLWAHHEAAKVSEQIQSTITESQTKEAAKAVEGNARVNASVAATRARVETRVQSLPRATDPDAEFFDSVCRDGGVYKADPRCVSSGGVKRKGGGAK